MSNLDPGDSAAKFANLASTIVSNLKSPDILAVQEIQDSNGATNDSVVDASATYGMLIAAIKAAGGPTYEFRQIDPVDDADGGFLRATVPVTGLQSALSQLPTSRGGLNANRPLRSLPVYTIIILADYRG